jgi:hypothetical protein
MSKNTINVLTYHNCHRLHSLHLLKDKQLHIATAVLWSMLEMGVDTIYEGTYFMVATANAVRHHRRNYHSQGWWMFLESAL